MADTTSLGKRVRALRRRRGMQQAELARRLEISASYLNMIEHGRRPLSAELLLRIATEFQVDLRELAAADEETLLADLMEVFGDPMLEDQEVLNVEVRDLVSANPSIARAVVTLYRAYRSTRESLDHLASRLDFDDAAQTGLPGSAEPSELVHEFIQRHGNHFDDLERGAEDLRRVARLDDTDMFQGLVDHLRDAHGTRVEIRTVSEMGGLLRRYEPEHRLLALSEALRRGSRNFNLAYVVGLLTQEDVLDHLTHDPMLAGDEARAVGRVALANYFAAAVLMPYSAFREAARAERHDVHVLGHRFRTSFEQVCHRLTTLARPGEEGIPFHMLRTDIAGNIFKRFSASGMRFARFSGACSRWNVFRAFLTPGRFRTGLTRLPDGTTFFEVAVTVQKESRGFHAQPPVQALGFGCQIQHARDVVYADGLDLESVEAARPIGITCRLCERMDCDDRAFPPLQTPLRVDENRRGVSFFAPVDDPGPASAG